MRICPRDVNFRPVVTVNSVPPVLTEADGDTLHPTQTPARHSYVLRNRPEAWLCVVPPMSWDTECYSPRTTR
nr:MAG TPA: hypothetical protein [Caudoviricetes sp.]